MNLMWAYERAKNHNGWAWHYRVSAPRLRRLVATRTSVCSRVAEFTGIDVESLRVEKPPVQMEHARITLLRLIQVWAFSDTMIESIQASSAVDGAVTLSLTGDNITAFHLEQVLDPERHPFTFVSNREIDQSGTFSPVSEDTFSLDTFLSGFESRFVSFAVEKQFDIFWFITEDTFHFFAPKQIIDSNGFASFSETRLGTFHRSGLMAQLTDRRRGVKERPCGLWDVRATGDDEDIMDGVVQLIKWSCAKKNISKALIKYLGRHALDLEGVTSSLCCTFQKRGKKKGRVSPSFSLVSRGKCSEVSKIDLNDLFATSSVSVKTRESKSVQQRIVFFPAANAPIPYDKQKTKMTAGDHGPETSWCRPLLDDIPEGARVLSVLASGRRKEHSIRLSPDEDSEESEEKENDGSYLEVFMKRDETKVSQRWRQFSSDRSVYVAENSVPAAAMSRQGPIEIFACCANTLEVRGGGLRVEGLTLLPPGRLFTLLSLLTFGLQPFSTGQIFGDDEGESLLSQSLRWLNTWDDLVAGLGASAPKISPDIDRVQRILAAKAFHSSCEELGEALVCYPDKVRDLCKIFDMIDGYSVVPWDDLDDNPFTEENLRRGKSKKKEQASRPVVNGHSPDVPSDTSTKPSVRYEETSRASMKSKKVKPPKKSKKRPSARSDQEEPVPPIRPPDKQKSSNGPHLRETVIVDVFPKEIVLVAARLFTTTLEPGESVDEMDLPSTNILCVVVNHYCDFLLQNNLLPEDQEEIALEGQVSFSDRHWLIRTVRDPKGKEWFLAEFVGTAMPFLSVKRRGGRLAGWVWQGNARPTNAKQALACVPPHMENIACYTAKIAFSECESGKAVFFDSVEMALRMEAAFWLERQFCDSSGHWYQQTLQQMLAKTTTLETVVPRGV